MSDEAAEQSGTLKIRCLRGEKIPFSWIFVQDQDGAVLTVTGEEPIDVKLVETITDEQVALRSQLTEQGIVDRATRDELKRNLDAFCQNHCLAPGQECQMRSRKEAE